MSMKDCIGLLRSEIWFLRYSVVLTFVVICKVKCLTINQNQGQRSTWHLRSEPSSSLVISKCNVLSIQCVMACGHVPECYEKRKRSDSALWQKPLHRQKNPKSNVTTHRTLPKTSIIQRLRTDLGRSAGVTIATQLVWLNRFTGSQPSH